MFRASGSRSTTYRTLIPRSVVVSLNVFGTCFSISGSSAARLARIGTTMVESSGGGGGVGGEAGGAGADAVCGGVAAAGPQANASGMKISVIIFRTVMSDATTRGIRVEVESEYLADRSDPSAREYYFAYHVRISNMGNETSQLISREWIITDGNGNVERVQGPGVVGDYPVLEPGGAYEYTSFCPLSTEVGMMHGSYTMRTRSGETFDAVIAPFTLATPGVVN